MVMKMKIKKKLVITLFLLCLLMIGAVSVANNDTVVSSDEMRIHILF